MRSLHLPVVTLPAVLALAACVPSVPQPTPAPPPTRTPAPAPAPAPAPPPPPSNWMDAAQTAGDWRYAAGSASFADAGGRALFTLACSNGQVTLAQPGTAATQMVVRSEALDRTLAAGVAGGATTATLPAGDRLLDAMAFSKGRFAIEVPGAAPLYLPAWPEVTRVIEDCR
ncbi:hypothetical protein V5740_07785 [Croceibacterium sp. TMG7-5b_MA50]|uniref:hypothetical protein n=1 Tax=Croceibacterium sp. TMG7-5b_MA50 TaxID=3121290 RepID=UPI003221857A